MANPNAVVSQTIRLDEPVFASGERQANDTEISIELDGERRVRLDPADPRTPGFARVLEGLSQQRHPVYVEIDPQTDAITRLLIPHVARVVRVTPGQGALDVELDPSHARHTMPLGGSDSEELEGLLREALDAREPVIVTEDDAHNIIDIRAFAPDPDWPLPPFPVPIPKPKFPPWPFDRLWWLAKLTWFWIRWPWWWWYGCVSMTRAQEVFNAMAATTCAPLTAPAPCIPFMYPDDGCWARAHEMSRLMINIGLSPNKVWIDASAGHYLHVNTRNSPQCYVEWGWHVAPTLCVRGPSLFQTQRLVIDPSLFTSPVTEATWKGLQGDPSAMLTHTGADQFWHSGGTDPTYAQSDSVLAYYRLRLQARAIAVGPPPYAGCP